MDTEDEEEEQEGGVEILETVEEGDEEEESSEEEQKEQEASPSRDTAKYATHMPPTPHPRPAHPCDTAARLKCMNAHASTLSRYMRPTLA